MEVQVLAACSNAFNTNPDAFTKKSPTMWIRKMEPHYPELHYYITNDISIVDPGDIYFHLTEKGLHFIRFTDPVKGLFHSQFTCFVVTNGGGANSIFPYRSKYHQWLTRSQLIHDVQDITFWMRNILDKLKTKQHAPLLKEIHQNELCLPFDLHTIITDYVFGVTFLSFV